MVAHGINATARGARQAMGTSFKATVAEWARLNGCDTERPPNSTRVTNTTTCASYGGCVAPVEACTVDGMGHKWPGHNEPQQKVRTRGLGYSSLAARRPSLRCFWTYRGHF